MNTRKNFLALIFFLTAALMPAYSQLRVQLGSDIDGEAAGDNSGLSVAMSSDGGRVAIGAQYNDGSGDNSGHVRIYEWNGTDWSQVGKDIDGEATLDFSGFSVALSSDGSRVAIGAYGNDGNGDRSGQVRIYEWNGSNWHQAGNDIDGEATFDFSGVSVALSSDGNRVAIGATENEGNGWASGHVRVYEWDGSNWHQAGNDIDGEAIGDYSGSSVSLSSDGNRVAIGAYQNDGKNGLNSGHVKIYEWNGTDWEQAGSDIDGEAIDDFSGFAVALSSDGRRVAVGARFNDGSGNNSGHVKIYEWDGSDWTQVGLDIDGEAVGDQSGTSVSLSADGSRVAIGATGNDGNGDNSGHVRVYEWDGSTWNQVDSDIDGEALGDESGRSVALSSDGNRVAIGAYQNDGKNGLNSGHVRIYADPFNYEKSSYCTDETDPVPIVIGLSGGIFDSTTGLSINSSTGEIDLAASMPGTYTVTYSVGSNSSTKKLTLTARDDASFSYVSASYCRDEADPVPTVTGLSGGTFSSITALSIHPSTGEIDLSASTAGNYTVTYTTTGICPQSETQNITLNARDDASFSYATASYCMNETDPAPTVTGLPGGTFSSTTGLSIHPSTGEIDLSASLAGNYTVTHTTSGVCPQSATQNITLTARDDASFSYVSTSYCRDEADPVPTVTGLTGGAFSSPTGLSIHPSTGKIDLTASTTGSNIVTYTTNGVCPQSETQSITLNALDDASFYYASSSYCRDGANPTPTVTGLSGGTFSSTLGLDIDAATGEIDLTASPDGTYTVTYTTHSDCPQSSTQQVTLTGMDNLPPVLSSCPPDITSTDPVVAYDLPQASDNCLISSVTRVEGLESGSSFPEGTTVVTYAFTDTGGNTTTCSFLVIIDEKNSEVDIPTAFSPNGDGVNDTWNILHMDQYPDARLRVFNLSGNEVFSSIGYPQEWDGSYRGKILPVASYYYVLDLNDPHDQKLKGKITIIK